MLVKVWWSVFWRALIAMPVSAFLVSSIEHFGETQGVAKGITLVVSLVVGLSMSFLPFYLGLRKYEISEPSGKK
jgi:hypothetical protein